MKKRLLRKLLKILNPIFSEKVYLKLRYRIELGKKLDLKNPTLFNEKLQWLKIYNRDPFLTNIVDKIKVKEIIKEKIGKEYIIPTLKSWNSLEMMERDDFSSLPSQFVIKTNHSGGNTGVKIVKDKHSIDRSVLNKAMESSLKSNIYKSYKEWPYKNVNRKIFVEKYLGDNLIDYKFFCFNGQVDSVMICIGRQENNKPTFYFFNREWELCRYNKAGMKAPEGFSYPKPQNLDKMFEIASILSNGFPFVRVDLYNVEGKIYFGELTFFPDSGFDPNLTEEANKFFGNKIDLSPIPQK